LASVERSSLVPAPAADVWARVVTPDGINDEFWPWLTFSIPTGSIPAGAGGITIDTIEVGKPVGRCWLRLFGILPVDYDDLTIVELEPGRRFLEQSRLFSAPQWQHERVVEPVDDTSTRLTDRLEFTPRRGFGLLGPRLIRLIFWNRHRRVLRHFSRV
jgi:ligand-binding SRPBCC domain-containing protein